MNSTEAHAVPRQHYLAVSLAKMVFMHPKRGIVFVREPIVRSEAARYDLKPLILYAVAPAGTALRHLVFSPEDQPLALSRVLWNAWEQCEMLRGAPDVLCVSRHVAKACPALEDVVKRAGITLRVADGKDKAFSAAMRTAQKDAMEIGWGLDKRPSLRTVTDLNAASARNLASDVAIRAWAYRGRPATERTEAWLALPRRATPTPAGEDIPWVPEPWLQAWEASLPPALGGVSRDKARNDT